MINVQCLMVNNYPNLLIFGMLGGFKSLSTLKRFLGYLLEILSYFWYSGAVKKTLCRK